MTWLIIPVEKFCTFLILSGLKIFVFTEKAWFLTELLFLKTWNECQHNPTHTLLVLHFLYAIKHFLMHKKNEHLAFLKITYYARRFLSTSFFVLYKKREKKTHKKGLMQKVQKVQEDWLANVSQKNRFLKYGKIVTFRRRVPETKKHIIYFNWHLWK